MILYKIVGINDERVSFSSVIHDYVQPEKYDCISQSADVTGALYILIVSDVIVFKLDDPIYQ